MMTMLAWVLVTLLYISSVGVATRGRGSRSSRQQDSAHLLQPEFGPAPNLTRVQVDSTAFLHCNVLNLQEDNQVGAPSINSYSRSLVVNKLFVIICLSFVHDLIFLVRFSTLLCLDLNDWSTINTVPCKLQSIAITLSVDGQCWLAPLLHIGAGPQCGHQHALQPPANFPHYAQMLQRRTFPQLVIHWVYLPTRPHVAAANNTRRGEVFKSYKLHFGEETRASHGDSRRFRNHCEGPSQLRHY